MTGYIDIPILEAARRVGLRLKESTVGRVEVEAHCPFCGDRPAAGGNGVCGRGTGVHLYLNTLKNIYYCQRCKASGNSITLYARLMNVDNKAAYRELTEGKVFALRPEPVVQQSDEQAPAPLHTRHDVYYDLLSLLELNEKHRQNLSGRGLSEERMKRNMYRSVPMDAAQASKITALLSDRYDLTGVPGFYTENGRWKMYRRHGFFVPVCTAEGYIQGLQIRLDGELHRKYRWFSSRYQENGTRAYPWIHVTGRQDSGTAVITEGALKADAASALSKDALFVAVPGINCLSGLPGVLKALNPTKVVEAFDMDKLQNPYVHQAAAEIRKTVQALGLQYLPYSWNPNYKGIDDYLLSRAIS